MVAGIAMTKSQQSHHDISIGLQAQVSRTQSRIRCLKTFRYLCLSAAAP
jgi:hypothetical protein